jgi:4-hydroxybenzoate polyprenyltransferase
MSNSILKLTSPLAFLSIFYVVPFFRIEGKKVAIRNYPYLKIFVIALVWTMVTTVLPYLNNNTKLNFYDLNFILLTIEHFIFILAITLPFDVRDLKYDLVSKVKTIPSKIGVRNTIILAEFLLAIFIGLKYYQFQLNHIPLDQFIAFSVATTITGTLIAFTSPKRPELFFAGLIEGTMVLMYVAVLIFQY